MKIVIDSKRLMGKGFACFIKDSAKNAIPEVYIDIDAMLNCCVGEKEINFKQLFSESVTHEILHVIEELFDKTFDENRVEQAILNAREDYDS